MAVGSSADIGIRVFLDDAASQGLFAINTQLGRLGMLSRNAGFGFGLMSANMLPLAGIVGLAGSFALFAGALIYSVDQGAKFQQTMLRIQVATSATADEMNRMQGYIIGLAGQSIFSIDQLAQGFVILGQRGFTATQIMDGMGQAGKNLAEAIKVDPVTAFTLLANTMNAFGVSAKDASHVADLLQFSMEHSTFQASGMTAALAKIGPVAVSLHEPMNETMVALDVTARAMGNMNTAGTSLYYFLRQIAAPATAKAADEMKKLGFSLYDSQGHARDLATVIDELAQKLKGMSTEDQMKALTTMFGTRASQGILALINHVKTFDQLMKQLRATHDNLGGAAAYAKQQEDSFSGTLNAAKTNVSSLAAIIGLSLLPTLTPIVAHIRDFVQGLINMAKAAGPSAGQFLVFGAALTGVALLIGVLLTPIGQFIVISLLVVGAVTALAAGIAYVSKQAAALSAPINACRGPLTGLAAVFAILGGVVRDAGHFISAAFGWALQQISGDLKQAGPGLKMFGELITNYVIPALKMLAVIIGAALIGVLHGLIAALAFIVAGLVGLFVGLATIIGGVFNVIKGVIQIFVGLVTGIFTGNWSTWNAGWHNFLNGLLMICVGAFIAIKGIFVGTLGAIAAFIFGFIHGVISFFTGLFNTLVGHSIIPQMMNSIHTVIVTGLNLAATAVTTWISKVVAFFAGLPAKIIAAISHLGSMLYQAGANIIQQLINGLLSKLGGILSAIGRIAGAISGHMPRSPAKEGPLRDIDKWMPTMMQMMSDSADHAMPTIRAMAGRIAGNIMPPTAARGGRGGPGGTTTYNLILDGRVLASWTLNYLTGQMQQNGLGRAFR